MKKMLLFFTLVVLFSACSPSAPIPTPTSTLLPTPTLTATPTPRPTHTPTPLPELSVDDVGLPIKDLDFFEYVPCYVFTQDRFHAGDIFNFKKSEDSIIVYSPMDGEIVSVKFTNDFNVGWEIIIKSPFILNSKRVYVDVVHVSGLYEGLDTGSTIMKGEPLAILESPFGNPCCGYGYIVDIAIRIGEHHQANPSCDNWKGSEYFSFGEYIEDDLLLLDENAYSFGFPCEGFPIPVEKQK